MAWVIKLSVLLAILIRTIHTDLYIKTEEESFNLYIPNSVDYCLISRSSDEGNLLLWNTSNPLDNPTLAGEIKDRLELKPDQNSSYLRINRLTQPDSGQYRKECWRDGRVMYQKSTDLLICSGLGKMKQLRVNTGETVKLQCEGTWDGDNMMVRWFQKCAKKIVKLSENSSSLLITNISLNNILHFDYMCVVLEGQLCVHTQVFTLHWSKVLSLSVGDEAVLTCFNHNDPNGAETWWSTKRFKNIRWDSNHLTGGGNQMYVSDGRTSGNYSLVIPSLMLNHSGNWECIREVKGQEIFIKGYELLVCPKSEPFTEFFSEGEEVVLSCNSNLTESDRVGWYRQTVQVDNVILDTEHKLANYPKDLDDRINVPNPPSFLVLANLSLADSGEYWCAVFYKGVCVSVTKTVLVVWDPFGINSMFYRVYSSLMGCALLGMVCVLITVNLKTRRRDQASLKTRRPAAQT